MLWHRIKRKTHNVFIKFSILCWATFIVTLGCIQPTGHGLNTPGSENTLCLGRHKTYVASHSNMAPVLSLVSLVASLKCSLAPCVQ